MTDVIRDSRTDESPTMTLSKRITRLSHSERGRLLAMLSGTIPQTVENTLDRMENDVRKRQHTKS